MENILIKKYQKHFVIATLLIFTVAICGNVYAGYAVVDNMTNEYKIFVKAQQATINVKEQAIVGMIIGALIGIYVASVLLPLIANRTNVLQASADLDANEQSLVGTWTLFIIIGVMGAIIGLAI